MPYRDNEPTPKSNADSLRSLDEKQDLLRDDMKKLDSKVDRMGDNRPIPDEQWWFSRVAVLGLIVAVGAAALTLHSCNADAHDCSRVCRGTGAEAGMIDQGTCICGGPMGAYRVDHAASDEDFEAPVRRLFEACAEQCGSYGVETTQISGREVSCTCR